MKILKAFWNRLQKILFFIGNLISGIFLFIFYYSIFMIFAVLFKIFSRPLAAKSKISNWSIRKSASFAIKDFTNE